MGEKKKQHSPVGLTNHFSKTSIAKQNLPFQQGSTDTVRYTKEMCVMRAFILIFVFRGCNIYWEISIDLCFLAAKYSECVEYKTYFGGRILVQNKNTYISFPEVSICFFPTVLKACCCHCCCIGLTVLSEVRCFKHRLP